MKPAVRRLGLVALTVLLGAVAAWLLLATGTVEKTDNAYAKADSIAISPKVSGYVADVAVQDNQSVRAGQALLRIDAADYAARLEQSGAARRSQQAALATLEQQKRLQRAQIVQAQAALQAAAVEAGRLAGDYRRDAALLGQSFATLEQVEHALAAARVGVATVARAGAELQAAREQFNISVARQAQLDAELQQSEALVKIGQLDVDGTVLTAPVNGVVGNKAVEVGQYVKAGTQLMAVVPDGQAYVMANFKETQIRAMHIGQPATIAVDAFPGTVLHGAIDSIAPATGSEFSFLPLENATGNFTKIVQRVPVKIRLGRGQPLAAMLKPGMSLSVAVDTGATAGSEPAQASAEHDAAPHIRAREAAAAVPDPPAPAQRRFVAAAPTTPAVMPASR